ncbi:MAG: hypothetical protein ACOYNM_15890 [Gemmataceae bacterium]
MAPCESQIRQSLVKKVRNIPSALKMIAVHLPNGVHLGKISTKECRSITGGLGCFGVS